MRCEFSPWVGRAPGGGHGNPLQYFAWTIPWTEEPEGSQSVGSQSRMGLKWLSTHAGYEHWYSTTNLSSAGIPTLSTAPGFFFSPGSHAVSHRALSYHVSLVSSSLGQFPQALSSLITALLKSSGQLLCRMFLIRGVSGAFPELDWGFSFLAQMPTEVIFFKTLFICKMLLPWPGTEPVPPPLGVWSLNHWTAREAPRRNVVFSAHHTRRNVMPIHLISADRKFYPLDTVVSIRFIHGKVTFVPFVIISILCGDILRL